MFELALGSGCFFVVCPCYRMFSCFVLCLVSVLCFALSVFVVCHSLVLFRCCFVGGKPHNCIRTETASCHASTPAVCGLPHKLQFAARLLSIRSDDDLFFSQPELAGPSGRYVCYNRMFFVLCAVCLLRPSRTCLRPLNLRDSPGY